MIPHPQVAASVRLDSGASSSSSGDWANILQLHSVLQQLNAGHPVCVCRVRDAVAGQWAASPGGMAREATPNLVGEFLGRARTPRWLGDPYGVDEHGTALMGPDRVSLPNIAARSRCTLLTNLRSTLSLLRPGDVGQTSKLETVLLTV